VEAIFFLIIIGVVVAGGFLAAFIWAVRSGQYEDDYSPSVRILFDQKKPKKKKDEANSIQDNDTIDKKKEH
jgi:cbb3-type cytochrome oxidase maturation protein